MSSSIFPITQEHRYFLYSEKPEIQAQLHSLSTKTGISILNKASEGHCLEILEGGVRELYALSEPKMRIRADFTTGEFLHRLKTSGKNQPLAKSVGISRGNTKVLDATGGLGGDAMILASLGCHVTICERHPLLALLLEDGLRRAQKTLNFVQNISLRIVDALTYLKELSEKPEVIYLDPMYPTKEKSALPRKEMQILEGLVGADSDQETLFELALKKASDRVVIKRHKNTPPFQEPTHSFEGTTTRYDMYLTK